MDAIDWVRHFFEEQLAGVDAEVGLHLVGTAVSTEQLVAYLVDQTVQRAALDATAHAADGRVSRGETDISWERCLMVAAFTELRSVKLLARN